MREIKFRLWDPQRKVMTQDGSLITWIRSANIKFCDDFVKMKMVFLQFTGRKDNEGKDIYEGDIIEFDKAEWGGEGNIHVVSWDNNDSAWCWGGGASSDMEWRKVIGNIYENPELLNQKDPDDD